MSYYRIVALKRDNAYRVDS